MSVLTQRASDVRINEYDMSQVVTSNSVTLAAQIVVSKQGRSDEPQHWTNAQNYMDAYGPPTASVSFDVYCGLDYFKEGNDLWALRVVGAGALYSGVVLAKNGPDTILVPAPSGIVDPESVDLTTLVDPGVVPLALFYPNKGQGSYGDAYAISVDSANIGQISDVQASATSGNGNLGPGTYTYQVSAIGETGETLASQSVEVIIAGSSPSDHSITIEWPREPRAIGYYLYGRVSGSGYGRMVQVGQENTPVISFTDLGTVVPDATNPPITDPNALPEADPTFVVNVYDTNRSTVIPLESFNCTLTENTDGDGVSTELEERINPFSEYVLVRSNAGSLFAPEKISVDSAPVTNMNGGDSGAAPTSFDVARAWAVFSNREKYEINCLINSGHSTPEVGLAMEELARTRGDSIAFLDTPSAKQKFQQAINYRNLELNLNSSYAALFCPDVLEVDTINGKQQYVPFSGWAAALAARTARVANQSFSIAGLNRGLVGVLKTRESYDDPQASALFRAQVNYTRTFIGQGIALWEQKTLQAKDSALSWISVRILTNIIKVSLYKFGLYILQEPNDDATRRQLVQSFSDYLETWKNARGLRGYQVICDSSNNSEAQYESGVLRVAVLLRPTVPIHELQIDVVITKSGVSFTETVRQLYG